MFSFTVIYLMHTHLSESLNCGFKNTFVCFSGRKVLAACWAEHPQSFKKVPEDTCFHTLKECTLPLSLIALSQEDDIRTTITVHHSLTVHLGSDRSICSDKWAFRSLLWKFSNSQNVYNYVTQAQKWQHAGCSAFPGAVCMRSDLIGNNWKNCLATCGPRP